MRKTLAHFLLMVLGALGLGSCEEPVVEYACGYADYSLSGTVLDADGSVAIEGIEIRVGRGNSLMTYSSAEGTWSIEGRLVCALSKDLYVADVDGEENGGTFAADTLVLDPPRRTGLDKWYSGRYDQQGIVIKLRKTP